MKSIQLWRLLNLLPVAELRTFERSDAFVFRLLILGRPHFLVVIDGAFRCGRTEFQRQQVHVVVHEVHFRQAGRGGAAQRAGSRDDLLEALTVVPDNPVGRVLGWVGVVGVPAVAMRGEQDVRLIVLEVRRQRAQHSLDSSVDCSAKEGVKGDVPRRRGLSLRQY